MSNASARILQFVMLLAISRTARCFTSIAAPHAIGPAASISQKAPSVRGMSDAQARNLRRAALTKSSVPLNLRGGGLVMAAGNGGEEETLVQYVVLRRDLTEQGWPMGSVVAQGCHAVSKALWEMKEEENVIKYCSDIDNMHKVVLGARDEKTLRKVAKKLEDEGLKHSLWIEQPENYATALAVMPYPRSVIAPHLKKLSLLK